MRNCCSCISLARAYSLAVLAAEEWAKAYSVVTLSFMTPEMRAEIPVRDFLGGHRMKMTGALLLIVLDGARPGVASRVPRCHLLTFSVRHIARLP